ncbi:MAG: class I SAM-dependent methyltransferase [Planctomycetota bacterium]|nr:class I SAM-dependent methyltransferase [Planctomycetota bacterium]
MPESATIQDILRQSTCPACAHHVAVRFFDGGHLPLTTLAWPKSANEAKAMKRLPHSFVRCVDCGHVYNADFSYAEVPYSDKPNLMFNKGEIWSEHLRAVVELLIERLPSDPIVIEIGCGEGHLLRALAGACRGGRFIGFDPNASIDAGDAFEARAELFDPAVHLAEFRPDLVISRHVFEHLMNPLGFVQSLAFAAAWEHCPTRLFIEVPCIDRVFEMGRTVDFFYEHNSHFTTQSMSRMLERCASGVDMIETGYNDEVLFALAEFGERQQAVDFAESANAFRNRVRRSHETIQRELDILARSEYSVAIWGGTGKAAAFINQLGLDAQRFPTVVDSDPDKAGTHVPGTGQLIRHRDHLLEHPVDFIVIATQWRAADIALEIQRTGIRHQAIVIEYQGRLIDFLRDEHPYRIEPSDRSNESDYIEPIPRPKFLSRRVRTRLMKEAS